MTTYSGQALIQQMDTLEVPKGCAALWALGQMGYALKIGTEIVYIDPCLSDVAALRSTDLRAEFARAFPPPLEPAQVTNAAYVLCSHEHIDHTDPLTLGPLARSSPDSRIVATGWSADLLDEAGIPPARRFVPQVGQPFQLGSLRVTAIPAAHYEIEHDPVQGHRWLSFLIEGNGVAVFHSGDTLPLPTIVDHVRGLPPIDLGIVAVNGRDARRDSYGITGNLWPSEAVWLASHLHWDVLIEGHNDLYAWNTIPAGLLSEEARRIAPELKVHSLKPGELYFYVR